MTTTISETAETLRSIALNCGDSRGYFAAMYARVTTQIAQRGQRHPRRDLRRDPR